VGVGQRAREPRSGFLYWNTWALRAHRSAKVFGARQSRRSTVSVRNLAVSARMWAKPSTMASASAGGAPAGEAEPDGVGCRGHGTYLDVPACRGGRHLDLFGDGERLLAGQDVLPAVVAVLDEGERGVDRRVAARPDRVEDEARRSDGGWPFGGIGHEAAGTWRGMPE
jgi:hypothetical protein